MSFESQGNGIREIPTLITERTVDSQLPIPQTLAVNPN
jgi:hypothetical protein